MDNQKFGRFIRDLRKKANMTQKELGEKLNVTDKAVSKWERDLACPDVSTLPKLAEIFDVSVDELMQCKAESQNEKEKDFTSVIHMIMKAVALAMGVGVVVLSILKELEVDSGMAMLGIGLACLAITSLAKKDER